MKKNKNLSELMSYAGKHRYLTHIIGNQCIFSTIAVCIHIFYHQRGDRGSTEFFRSVGRCTKRMACSCVCVDFHCDLYQRSDVFTFISVQNCRKYA